MREADEPPDDRSSTIIKEQANKYPEERTYLDHLKSDGRPPESSRGIGYKPSQPLSPSCHCSRETGTTADLGNQRALIPGMDKQTGFSRNTRGNLCCTQNPAEFSKLKLHPSHQTNLNLIPGQGNCCTEIDKANTAYILCPGFGKGI